MFPSLTLALALALPGAPVPKDVAPAGPAPYILNLKSDDGGAVRFTVIRTEKVKVMQVVIQAGPNGQGVPMQIESEVNIQKVVRAELSDLKDIKVYNTEGKEVELKDAAKKLSSASLAIASSNGQKVDAAFLKLFKDDVLILVSPDLAARGGNNYLYPPMPQAMPAMPAIQALPAAPLLPPPLPPAPGK